MQGRGLVAHALGGQLFAPLLPQRPSPGPGPPEPAVAAPPAPVAPSRVRLPLGRSPPRDTAGGRAFQLSARPRGSVAAGSTTSRRDLVDEERSCAILKWLRVLHCCDPLASTLPPTTDHDSTLATLTDCLESRSTATLDKRGDALARYLAWFDRGGDVGVRWGEESVYRYVTTLRERADSGQGGATAATSFLESLGLARAVLGLDTAPACLSARVRGAALAAFKRKRLTVQAPPFAVEHLRSLEQLFLDSCTLPDRLDPIGSYILGFFLFLTYTRSRCKDGVRIEVEPTLDVVLSADGATPVGGYLEASGGIVKTGNTLRKLRRALPIAGPAVGLVRGRSWASEWLRLRSQLGMNASDVACLCCSPRDADAGTEPMRTSEANRWLKYLCEVAGVPAIYGTHSCKATLLSWCAKGGVKGGDRRLLGAHAAVKDRSMLEYSRDAMGQPLRSLDSILEAVRSGAFLPDSTRSGRFVVEPAQPVSAKSASSCETLCCSCAEAIATLDISLPCDGCGKGAHGKIPCLGECGRCGQRLCSVCRPRSQHACAEGAASSSGTSSDSETDGSTAEPADPAASRADAVQNRRTKRIHRCLAGTGGVPLCGASLRPVDVLLPPTDWARELLCKRQHCYPCGPDP